MSKLRLNKMTPSQLAYYHLIAPTTAPPKRDWAAIAEALDAEPDLLYKVTCWLDYMTTPYIAAMDGTEKSLALLKQLLEQGLSPDYRPEGGPWPTPLTIAVYHDKKPAITLLLEFGADPDLPDQNGDNALHIALDRMRVSDLKKNDYLETIRLLAAKGADPNLGDASQNTALHLAYDNRFYNQYMLNGFIEAERNKQPGEEPWPEVYTFRYYSEHINHYRDSAPLVDQVIELLLEKGADSSLRNVFGQTPLDCGREGIKKDEDKYSALLSICRTNDQGITGAEAKASVETEIIPRRPTNRKLARSLNLIPDHWLRPPATAEQIDELNARLNGKLPPEIIELYQHHGGMDKEAYDWHFMELGLRLMTPEEVLEQLWIYANEESYQDPFVAPWNNGSSTCYFWTDGYQYHAGLYLDGPLKGKVYIWDYEPVAPYPNYRDVASFYRWLTSKLSGEKEIYDDYPSYSAATEDPADREISRRLLKEWEEGGRLDDFMGICALYLSSVSDSGEWVRVLSALISQPDPEKLSYDLIGPICQVLGGRKYKPALEVLTRVSQYRMFNDAAQSAIDNIKKTKTAYLFNKIKGLFS